jgi:hypothetical protein
VGDHVGIPGVVLFVVFEYDITQWLAKAAELPNHSSHCAECRVNLKQCVWPVCILCVQLWAETGELQLRTLAVHYNYLQWNSEIGSHC